MSILEITREEFESFNISRVEQLPEQQWFQDENGNIIGTIYYDAVDNTFGSAILARDIDGVFKWISGNTSIDRNLSPELEVVSKMENIERTKISVFPQDDVDSWYDVVNRHHPFKDDKNQSSEKEIKNSLNRIIDILLPKFNEYCISIGAKRNTIEESYAEIIGRYNSPEYDPDFDGFNHIISKANAFNVDHDLVNKHAQLSSTDVESFLYMANAYSLRIAAFGEMLHGGITQEMADYFTGLNFKFAQEKTCHKEFSGKEFQNLSVNSTYGLVKYIDKEINIDGLQKYVICAIRNKKQINFTCENANAIQWEVIISFLDYVSTLEILTPSILNKFISEYSKPNSAIK